MRHDESRVQRGLRRVRVQLGRSARNSPILRRGRPPSGARTGLPMQDIFNPRRAVHRTFGATVGGGFGCAHVDTQDCDERKAVRDFYEEPSAGVELNAIDFVRVSLRAGHRAVAADQRKAARTGPCSTRSSAPLLRSKSSRPARFSMDGICRKGSPIVWTPKQTDYWPAVGSPADRKRLAVQTSLHRFAAGREGS